MSIFVIKIIAMISMVLDHIKYAIPEFQNFATIYLGRIAMPLFAFMIAEGYVHTKDVNKYMKRIVIAAIVSQIPFMMFRYLTGDWLLLNILFAFVFGLFAIAIYDKLNNKILALAIDIALMIAAYFMKIEYGWYAVAMVLTFYMFRKNKILMSCMFSLLVLAYYASRGLFVLKIEAITYIVCTILPLIFILLYNGKKGKDTKRILYYFYPIHFVLLFLLSFI